MILTSSSWLMFWLESGVSNLLRIRIVITNNNSLIIKSHLPLGQSGLQSAAFWHAGEKRD